MDVGVCEEGGGGRRGEKGGGGGRRGEEGGGGGRRGVVV